MLAALCIGVWAGSGVLAEADAEAASTALGAILALYALIGLSLRQMPRLPFRHEGWLGPLAGGETGLATAVTGVFVVSSVPYLQALGLERDHLVQALGLTFTVATLALAASLVDSGAMNVHSTSLYSLVILASLTGMVIGRAIRSKIAAHSFRRAFLIGLLLLGCSLILKRFL